MNWVMLPVLSIGVRLSWLVAKVEDGVVVQLASTIFLRWWGKRIVVGFYFKFVAYSFVGR